MEEFINKKLTELDSKFFGEVFLGGDDGYPETEDHKELVTWLRTALEEAYEEGSKDKGAENYIEGDDDGYIMGLRKASEILKKMRDEAPCTEKEFGYHDKNCELGCWSLDEARATILKEAEGKEEL